MKIINFQKFKKAKSIDDIYLKVKKKAKWLKIDYGKDYYLLKT